MKNQWIQALINTARKRAPEATMVTSAELCAVDAQDLFDRGEYEAAAQRGLDSLKYSLGILSPTYESFAFLARTGEAGMSEQQAEDIILKWCRSDARKPACPGMRQMPKAPKCRVIDLARTEKDPDAEYDWERRHIRYAAGETWLECAAQLGLVAGVRA